MVFEVVGIEKIGIRKFGGKNFEPSTKKAVVSDAQVACLKIKLAR
jgi:hypothetical protein